MYKDEDFAIDGNTMKYTGNEELPECVACKSGTSSHELLTKEHPYKMIESEKKEGDH